MTSCYLENRRIEFRQERKSIPQSHINNLIASMQNRPVLALSTHHNSNQKPSDPLDAATKSRQTNLTQQSKPSDTLDAANKFVTSHAHHHKYIVRSPIYQLTEIEERFGSIYIHSYSPHLKCLSVLHGSFRSVPLSSPPLLLAKEDLTFDHMMAS
ncbi:hypothetical protein TNCV_4073111 [Trichonephila clavipes]|uniref:Uncharacterized protein n=1 Tax=Trichonephila clavipes TaxID=2585209 RepID=A0A8X6W826_TRICX|nr:hypothetical protein TNCV_4073111 [Trichonephila clavipes]